jgi:hypothetical protein
MKQIIDSDKGPVIVCDVCFERLKKRRGVTLVFEEVTGIVPPEQKCDLCGVLSVAILRGSGKCSKILFNGEEIAEMISFEMMENR